MSLGSFARIRRWCPGFRARPGRTPWAGWVLGSLGVLSLTSACGWHSGFVLPENGKSIGVEVFSTARNLHERNLEPILADALSRAVMDWVGAPLRSPQDADLVIRGQILDYRRRPGVRNEQNRLIETGVLISIRAELVDRRTGKVLSAPGSEHVWTGYLLGDEASAHEAEARGRSIEHVAESLVLNLFGPNRVPVP